MCFLFFLLIPRPSGSSLFPYTTLFRSCIKAYLSNTPRARKDPRTSSRGCSFIDRKSTRLNSSHQIISYAVFCLKKKKMMDDGSLAGLDLDRLEVTIHGQSRLDVVSALP